MKGEFLPLVPPAEAAAHPYSPIDRERLSQHRARLTVGGIDTVMRRLLPLIEATRADELMITSLIFDHAARRHSSSCWRRRSRSRRMLKSAGTPPRRVARYRAVLQRPYVTAAHLIHRPIGVAAVLV